jgi:hypothetical protein
VRLVLDEVLCLQTFEHFLGLIVELQMLIGQGPVDIGFLIVILLKSVLLFSQFSDSFVFFYNKLAPF